MAPFVTLAGQVFERLTVVEEAGRSRHGQVLWRCLCVCGRSKVVKSSHLREGRIRSCGCLLAEFNQQAHTTHAQSHSRLYRVWAGMLARCLNPRAPSWENYGGRGIVVCAEWQGPGGFERFHAHLGDPPFPGASLDRYPDNNGNYEPGNVRWASASEQARNTRCNRAITYAGKTQCLTAWAEELGLLVSTLHRRLKRGLSAERALRAGRLPRRRNDNIPTVGENL